LSGVFPLYHLTMAGLDPAIHLVPTKLDGRLNAAHGEFLE
jgi:hypothetical protein